MRIPYILGQMRAYVGIGSNVGDRRALLRDAVGDLTGLRRTALHAASRLYSTRPIGPSSDPFLNAVTALETDLDPWALLEAMLAIERDHGRVRRIRWDARTLDLDLLVCLAPDDSPITVSEKGLVLPHPRMFERDFVLAPLGDVAPTLELQGKTPGQHLHALPHPARTIQEIHPASCYLPQPPTGG